MMNRKNKLSGTERLKTPAGKIGPQKAKNFFPVESLWQTAFESLAEPVWVMDADCRIQRCNRAAQRFLGNHLVGRHCWEIAHGTQKRIPECPFSIMCRTGYREAADLPVGKRWFNCTVDPLFDASGKIAGALHVLWDVTDRRQAERSLQKAKTTLERRVVERTAELEKANQLLRHSERNLRRFVEHAPAAIAMFDRAMRYMAVSRRWLKDYRLEGRNIVGRSHYEVFPDLPRRWKVAHQRALAGEALREAEDRFERADGSVQWLRWELQPWFEAPRVVGGLIIFTEEITERKRSEHLLHRANQTLKAIRDCHEAMLRASTEAGLLEEICRIIVKIGGERMAWVGYAEKSPRKTVSLAAAAGFRKDYLAKARISWADTRRGHGPVGTAIRTGKVCICHNTLTDRAFAPWREVARQVGYGSVIALPLHLDGRCIGALAIYAPEPEAFDAAEQLLFADLANDLGFGLGALRLRAERDRLGNEILKSVEREQERIGRDLHDGLCQLLVGAKYHGVYVKKIASERFPALGREAEKLEAMLNQAIEQARDLARGLNPVPATPDGLSTALRKLAESVDGAKGPRCFCRIPGPVKIFDHHMAQHLYRIGQEAVQNAIKHAAASNVSIMLAGDRKNVVLTVKDDGCGTSRTPGKSGMGLGNMQMRAGLIGGRLEIRRRKYGGTAVTCELPHSRGARP